jgi:hypothetical protein
MLGTLFKSVQTNRDTSHRKSICMLSHLAPKLDLNLLLLLFTFVLLQQNPNLSDVFHNSDQTY